jgi:hypothetical protein
VDGYAVVHGSSAVPFESFLPCWRFICWKGDSTYCTRHFGRY